MKTPNSPEFTESLHRFNVPHEHVGELKRLVNILSQSPDDLDIDAFTTAYRLAQRHGDEGALRFLRKHLLSFSNLISDSEFFQFILESTNAEIEENRSKIKALFSRFLGFIEDKEGFITQRFKFLETLFKDRKMDRATFEFFNNAQNGRNFFKKLLNISDLVAVFIELRSALAGENTRLEFYLENGELKVEETNIMPEVEAEPGEIFHLRTQIENSILPLSRPVTEELYKKFCTSEFLISKNILYHF